MRKVAKDRPSNFPAVSLFRDDVEDLIALLAPDGQRLVISDDEYAFDTLDEFIEKRGTMPRRFTLRQDHDGYNMSLSINRFSLVGVSFYTWGQEATYFKVREILLARRRLLARVFVPVPWFGVAATAWAVRFAESLGAQLGFLSTTLNFLSLLGVCFGMLGSVLQSGFGSTVNLSRRHQTSSFLGRNAEKLLSGAVGALLGAFGKAIADWFVALLKHSSP